MAPQTGQDICGFFSNVGPPPHFGVTRDIDQTAVDLPNVLSEDELQPLEYPSIKESSQIRLISLLPPKLVSDLGESREPIECEIEVHSLTDAPKYEALSYTWGGIQRHMPISVLRRNDDGNEIERALFTTPQLLMALRRLRLVSTARRLWIDQLCIDQDNPKEVGAQVQLMGEIYRTARRVVIWLGEDRMRLNPSLKYEADSTHLLHLIREIPPNSSNATDNTTQVTSLIKFDYTKQFECIKLRRLRAVYELLWRPWFQRAWVFQEASLAKELSVQFGKAEMEFADLENVCSAIYCAEVDLGIHRDSLGLGNLAKSTAGYEMIRLIQQTRQETFYPPPPGETSGIEDQKFLCKLLQVLRRVRCYNPRDLVFAFLAFQDGEGILSTGSAYQQSVAEIWRIAAEKIIQRSRSLDIFAALSAGTSLIEKDPSWATWVPRWDNCMPYGCPIATPVSQFKACRSMLHQWDESEGPQKLVVKGKIIDIIQKRFKNTIIAPDIQKAALSFTLAWDGNIQNAKQHLYNHEIREKLGHYLPIKIATLERDVMRALLADGALGSSQPLRRIDRFVDIIKKSEEVRHLRRDRHSLTAHQQQMVVDYELLEDLALVAKQKELFFTKRIDLGLVAAAAQEGDFIAILHGSKVPIVLRKAAGKPNEYRAICQCYLNGWMYGESPKQVYNKDTSEQLYIHQRWWEELPDTFVLV